MRISFSLCFALLLLLLLAGVSPAQNPSFYNFAVDQDHLSGAPDYSWLNHPLTAADRLYVSNGHFYTLGADGTPNTADDQRVRFFGVSFAFGANFPDATNGDAQRIAKRLRRMGINLVRLHHMDSVQDAPANALDANGLLTTDPYPSFNPVSIARLRNFLDAFKAEGIYVDLNLHVGYVFRPAVDNVPSLPNGMPDQSKPLHIFYPRMVALQQQYATQLINLLKLKNDPVLAMVEISNESSIVQAWQWNQLEPFLIGDYKTALEVQWNAWLKTKYRTTAALAAAWGPTTPNGPNLLIGNWTLEPHGVASGRLTIDSSSGASAAHVSNVVGGDWLFLKQTLFHMQAGNRYIWTFDARADLAANASANVNWSIMRDVSPWDGYGSGTIALTNQWQTFTLGASAGFDINDSGRVMVDLENVGHDVYVRNATLVASGQQGLGSGETLELANVQRPGPSDGSGSPRMQDYVAFLIATDGAYMTMLRDSVRSVTDALTPITGTQLGYGGLSVMDSQAQLDYQDNHFYIDHPGFPNIAWDPWDWRIVDQAAGDDGWGALIDMSWGRQSGRPYTVSEFNQPWPNRHGMEVDPVTAAVAAFQDWDAIMHFDYIGGRNWDNIAPGAFDLNSDWTKYPLIGQSAWLFRTAAIQRGATPLSLHATARQRQQSAVLGQSPTTWVESVAGVPKQNALVHRVEIDALDPSQTQAPPPPAGAQQPLVPPYVSDSGELNFDPAVKLLTIDTPAAAGLVGAIGAGVKRTAGAIDVDLPAASRGFGSWLLTSLDNSPLGQSTSMLLTLPGYSLRSIPAAGESQPNAATAQPLMLVNYLNNTSWWTLDPTNASPGWGTWQGKQPPSGNFGSGYAPTFMERIEGWLTLRTSALSIHVAVLDGAGNPVGSLPASEIQSVSGGYRVHINGDVQAASLRLSPWYAITATQPCNYSVAPLAPDPVAIAGGSLTLNVTVANGCNWSLGTLPSWIGIASGSSSGIGPGGVTLAIAANQGLARNATVTLAGASVAISQSGITCTYGVSTNGWIFPPAGGSGSVAVGTPLVCAWTIANVPNWMTISAGASSAGPLNLTLTAAANTGAARAGTLTIAGVPVTVEQGAGNLTLAAAGSLAHYASGGIWDTTLTLVNTTAAPKTAQWNFFDDSGAAQPLTLTLPAPGPSGVSGTTLQRTLSPGALLTVNGSNSASSQELQGGAQLLSTGGIDGFGVFRGTFKSGNVQEAVVPLETRGAASYLVPFDNTHGYFNGVAIANLTTAAVNIAVTMRDGISGSVVGTRLFSLPASGHTAFLLNDPALGYAETANITGTLQFTTASGGQISVLGLRFNLGGAFTSIPVIVPAATVPGGQLLANGSAAHFDFGGGWTTTYTLVNSSPAAAAFQLNFFDDAGNPVQAPLSFPQSPVTPALIVLTASYSAALPAGTALQIQVSAPGNATGQTGWAQLLSQGGVGGSAVFEYLPLKGGKQEAVVPFETRQTSSYVLAYDNANRYFSGVALANTTSAPVQIAITVRDGATGSVLGTHTLTLPAQGHKAFLLSDAALGYPETANGVGTIEYATPAVNQISVLGLRFNANAAFTSTPALAK